jgi:hypothetical protein
VAVFIAPSPFAGEGWGEGLTVTVDQIVSVHCQLKQLNQSGGPGAWVGGMWHVVSISVYSLV